MIDKRKIDFDKLVRCVFDEDVLLSYDGAVRRAKRIMCICPPELEKTSLNGQKGCHFRTYISEIFQ
jgi:hypothetical protein